MPLILKIKHDKNGVPTLADAREAEAQVESAGSGGYTAVGPRTKTGDRAYGRYQVMGANIPSWTKEVTGKAMTPQQFLADPAVQDQVFNTKFGQAMTKYGNAQDAASVWFSGKPLAQAAGRHDITGTSAEQYVNKFNNALGVGGDNGLGTSSIAPVAPAAQSRPFGSLVTPVGDVVNIGKYLHTPDLLGQQMGAAQRPGGFGSKWYDPNYAAQQFGVPVENIRPLEKPSGEVINRVGSNSVDSWRAATGSGKPYVPPSMQDMIGTAGEAAKPITQQLGGGQVPWLRDPLALQNKMATRLAKAQTTMPQAARKDLAEWMGRISVENDPTARASLISILSDVMKEMGY